MQIVLTGGTGYIGSALLQQLIAAGHTVTALVRGDEAAAKAGKAGATPAVGDLFDIGWVASQFAAGDAAIHTAATGDAETRRLDRGIVAAAVEAFGGSGKPFVHTSGIWIYGNNPNITEESPFEPPTLTSWRLEVERSLLDADVAATIIAPPIVYGHGGGIPGGVLAPARDEQGRVRLVGDGSQHWPTVHVEDVAVLYRIVVERGEKLGHVIGASGANPTVRELAEAASGGAGVAPESVETSKERLGALFAEALLLDQQTEAGKAHSLGWSAMQPPLIEEFTATR